SGHKAPTQEIIGKEWTTAGISGTASYDELTFLFASLFDKATPTSNVGGSETWVFTPSVSDEDTIASFTIEQGSSVRAHKFVGAIVTELSLAGNRDEITLGGSIMAQLLTDGIALSADPV